MPWKQQGGGGGGGPWGSGGGGGGPWGGGGGGGGGPQSPDFEDLIRRGQDRVKQILPGGFGTGRGIILIVLLIILAWLFSGFYRVQPGEQGVELLLGRYSDTTPTGLHWWWPSPIGERHTPNVERTNQTSIGFRGISRGATEGEIRDVPQESLMLTGDQNIIDIDFLVQWRIKSAKDYLFNIRNPDATVKLAAESAIREIVGQTPLEDALATKRQEVEAKTQVLLQKILDEYGAGVTIAEIKMQKVDPPKPVIDAFNDVQRAKQDRERQQNEADAYRNDILPKAKGEAERVIQEATGYKEQLVKEAEGEAKRFLSVLAAYRTGKEVTRNRLFLERMQEVFRKSNKVIIDNGPGGQGVIPYLPLPELKKRGGGAN